jgi:antitoxin component YwqK of YwqJK toxin-antitoxin module
VASPSFVFVLGADGKKKEQCPFVGAVLEGPYLAWHSDGTPLLRGHYREGRKQGRWEQWGPSSLQVAEGSYRDGALVAGAPVGAPSSCEGRVFQP